MLRTEPKLVLASSSPYRRQQLAQLALRFECVSPNIDETPLLSETPSALATRLACEKARCIYEQTENCVVIGADQTAELGDTIIGKPGSERAARAQLRAASGKTLVFNSAVCVIANAGEYCRNVPTAVTFRELTNTQIDTYLAADHPYDCAGSFKAESLGISLFSKIESEDPSALIGLPLISLSAMLSAIGFDPLGR